SSTVAQSQSDIDAASSHHDDEAAQTPAGRPPTTRPRRTRSYARRWHRRRGDRQSVPVSQPLHHYITTCARVRFSQNYIVRSSADAGIDDTTTLYPLPAR